MDKLIFMSPSHPSKKKERKKEKVKNKDTHSELWQTDFVCINQFHHQINQIREGTI